MDGSEIDAVRALLNSKPRPVGWVQRRERLDEVGSVWPVADDVNLELVAISTVCPANGRSRQAVTAQASRCEKAAAFAGVLAALADGPVRSRKNLRGSPPG